MSAEGIFLDNYIKDDLIFYATELVQDHHYQEFMINLTATEEDNRYHNW